MATRAPANPAAATRFTPTGPYAYRKPIVPLAQQLAATGETPAARIARLRAEADAAKMKLNEISWIDRVIDRGRVWADRAHRVTVYGLIGASIFCGAVTIYTVTDIVTTNRKNLRIYHEAESYHLRTMTPESRMLAVRAAQNFNLPEDRAAFYVDNQVRLKQREEAGRIVAEQMRAAGLKPEEDEVSFTDKIKNWASTLFSAGEMVDDVRAEIKPDFKPEYKSEFVPNTFNPEGGQSVVEKLAEKKEEAKAEGRSSWSTVKGWVGLGR